MASSGYPAVGQWKSQSGKTISAPPNVGSAAGNPNPEQRLQALQDNTYTDAQYAAMQAWANSYFDVDTQNQSHFTGGNYHSTTATGYGGGTESVIIVGNFDMALADIYEGVTYDPGQAIYDASLPSIPNPLTPLENMYHSVTGFLNELSKGSTWVRVGEFVGGIVLIGVAASAVLKPGSIAGKTAKVAASPASVVGKAATSLTKKPAPAAPAKAQLPKQKFVRSVSNPAPAKAGTTPKGHADILAQGNKARGPAWDLNGPGKPRLIYSRSNVLGA